MFFASTSGRSKIDALCSPSGVDDYQRLQSMFVLTPTVMTNLLIYLPLVDKYGDTLKLTNIIYRDGKMDLTLPQAALMFSLGILFYIFILCEPVFFSLPWAGFTVLNRLGICQCRNHSFSPGASDVDAQCFQSLNQSQHTLINVSYPYV